MLKSQDEIDITLQADPHVAILQKQPYQHFTSRAEGRLKMGTAHTLQYTTTEPPAEDVRDKMGLVRERWRLWISRA